MAFLRSPRTYALCALVLSSSYASAQPPADTPATLESLKAQVLNLEADAARTEEDLAYPAALRLSIDVSVVEPHLLIREISVYIDNAAAGHWVYSQTEAQALTWPGPPGRAGLQRLFRLQARPGKHRLRAEFSAARSDAAPGAATLRGHYEQDFEKEAMPQVLELAVGTAGRSLRLTPTLWSEQP